jgi:aarF domain-containing kinase
MILHHPLSLLKVRRAAELRDTITSLGPFFIKLGQALSIRPDILSPKAMVELQQLCDKVGNVEWCDPVGGLG